MTRRSLRPASALRSRYIALVPPTPALKPVAAAVALACMSFHIGAGRAIAMPTGAQVQAGVATVQQPNAQTLVVKQATDRAVINWNSFSIASGESVMFQQPSSRSVALNPVLGSDPSLIFGTLQSNGQLFLINPNGVLFGRGSSVDVGGIVASTLGISAQDFMNGRYVFNAAGNSGSVTNQGTIRAADGGFVALLGKQVSNSGTIVAQHGSVALGAGDSMLLDFNGDGLLNLKVNTAVAGARIDHAGLIQADGGRVVMSAQAKNALLGTVLNVEGVVMARGLAERNGVVYLDGGRSGVASVSGSIDVSSTNPDQRGGEARVLGEYVGLFGNATLNASGPAGGGTVLVGGDFQGKNADIPNARGTYVGRDARIQADATGKGDGGKVIVWADDTTKFFGQVAARGGPQGGDGGFVEVSGKASLQFRGRVDTTAPKGKFGTLLLDPDIVTIKGGDGDGEADGNSTFAGSATPGTVEFVDASPTTIFESEIEEQSKSASILIQATRSILIDNVPFTHASGNQGDGPGVLALAPNSSLTLQTRNNGAAESGIIDLVTGGAHGANLRIVTSGATGAIAVESGLQLNGNQPTDIRLPQMTGGAGGVSIAARQGGNINVGPIDTRGVAAANGSQNGGAVFLQGSAISVSSIDTSGGPGTTLGGGNAGAIVIADASGTITLSGNLTARGGNATTPNNVGGNGGGVTFPTPVVLGSNVSIDTRGGTGILGVNGTGGTVEFSNTINADAATNNRTLTVNSGTGTTRFQANIGSQQALADLDVTANVIDFPFSGSGPAPPLAVTVTAQGGNTITFNGEVQFAKDLTVNAGTNNVLFASTVEGALSSLTVNSAGTTTFSDSVGADSSISSLTLGGPGTTAINGGLVVTSGAQTYNGPATLGADTLLASIGNPTTVNTDISFGSTIQSPSTPRSLEVRTGGITTFGGAVGGANSPLGSLTTDAPGTTAINGGSIVTTGTQTYNDPVALGALTALNSQTGNITFSGSLAAGANAFTLTANGINLNGGANSVSGSSSLVLQPAADNVSIGIAGGAGTLALTGSNIAALSNGFSSITIGSTTGTGTTTVNAITFNDPVTLRQPGAGGSIVVNGPLTGADNASVALVAGDGITLNSNITTNNQPITLTGPVTLIGNPTLNAGSGNIDLLGNVNGAFNLAANTTGVTTLGGAVGGGTPLASFTAAGPGALVVSGPGITTTGSQTFTQPVTIGANTTFRATNGSITFTNPVNADAAANNRTLTLNAGSGVVLGQVGNTQALGGLTVSAAQLTLNGGIQVNGGGAVDLRNVAAVVFAPNIRIDTDSTGGTTNAGGVFFGPGSTLNPPSTSPNSSIIIDASADGGGRAGAVDLGTVGNLVPVALLTVTGDLVTVNGNAAASQVFISADQVRTDPVNGIITATRPFTDFSNANAALTLSGLTTAGTFGTAPPPDTNAIRVAVPGLFVVSPNANRNLPLVWLRGDLVSPPLYAFANSPTNRRVCYNGACSGPPFTAAELVALVEDPGRRSANAAILDELRRLLDEALMSGYAKENVRRQLVRGLVLETGPARPGIDEFKGDGVTGPQPCTPAPGGAPSGVLVCDGAK